MKRLSILFLTIVWIATCGQVKAQSLLFPNSIRYPLSTEMPNSLIYPDEHKSITGYVRGSAWGLGENFDYANLFSEIGIKGEYVKGFTEGYGFIKAEIRARDGEFFGDNETQFSLRDLYAGYKNEDFEITFGNQNIQWGRGIGANPTNNLSPSNGFILTSDGSDQKMYNLMLATKVYITPNLEWEVVGIPIYKMNHSRVDLLSIPVGAGTNIEPEKSFKNGSFASKLNLNGGPMGASISYFNGFDVNPGINTGVDETYTPFAFSQPFRKQTIGGDFMWLFSGRTNGKSSDPTNDLIVSTEIAYSIIDNPDNQAYIPQSNFEFSVGLVKQFWNNTKLDNFTVVLGYAGKYTPNFTEAVFPFDESSPTYGLDMARFIQKGIAQGFFGQYDDYVHSITGVFSKTFMHNKLAISLVTNYGFNSQATEVDGTTHSFLVYPKASWNITKDLTTSIGMFKLGGPGTDVVTPTMNGVFCDLKYNIRFK